MQFVILVIIFQIGYSKYRLKDETYQIKQPDSSSFLNFKVQSKDTNEQIVEMPFTNLLNMLDNPIFQNQFENMKTDQLQNTKTDKNSKSDKNSRSEQNNKLQNMRTEQNIKPQNNKDVQKTRLSNKCIINDKYQCSVCCLSNSQCGTKEQCENSAYNRKIVDMMTISLFSFFVVIYIINFYSHSGLLPKSPMKKLN